MKPKDLAKLAFVVIALGVSAAVAYSVFFKPSAAELMVVENICLNPACGADFQMEQRQLDEIRRARQAIVCPKCGSTETGLAYRCGLCDKVNKGVGHGSAPATCAFCKKPFTFAASRK